MKAYHFDSFNADLANKLFVVVFTTTQTYKMCFIRVSNLLHVLGLESVTFKEHL